MPFALALMATGFFTFTQVGTDTSYVLLCGSLFVMGLGMGGTMMPIMTSALKTLTNHQVARGSTLLNITQQIASSIGVAIISVILTNSFKGKEIISQAQGFGEAAKAVKDPSQMPAILAEFPKVAEVLAKFGTDMAAGQAALLNAVHEAMADSFSTTLLVGACLTALTLIPALFLPRDREEAHLLDEEGDDEGARTPVLMH